MADKIVGFEGDLGSGAAINLSVPLPGTHSGKRHIIIDGLDDDIWSYDAWADGTPWPDALGVDTDNSNGELTWSLSTEAGPSSILERLRDGRLPSPLRPDESLITMVENAAVVDAFKYRENEGTLVHWQYRGDIVKPQLPDPEDGPQPAPDIIAQIIGTMQHSFTNLANGVVRVPVRHWAGNFTSHAIYLSAPQQQFRRMSAAPSLRDRSTPAPSTIAPASEEVDTSGIYPRLVIVQVYGISSFLGNYGLGRTVKTFTLLPGEEMSIYMRTWRSTTNTETLGRSIVDSYDETTGRTFAETLYAESSASTTEDETTNWYAEGEVKQGWGTGSARLEGGASGEYASSSEEFAKTTDETVQQQCYEASSHRETNITSSSEFSETVETEQVIERSIRNINVKRVLNFVFRELNQEYIVKTHLKDIRIAFTNGQSGSWTEVPISSLRWLLDKFVQPEHVNALAQDILGSILTVFDRDGDAVKMLERVESSDCGDTWNISLATRGDDCRVQPPTTDSTLFYRVRRGQREDNYALSQDSETHKVPGVLMRESTIVMRTDGVIVEALLGTSDAVDDYAANLQLAAISEKTLANAREELAQQIVRDGDAEKAELFQKLFANDDAETE